MTGEALVLEIIWGMGQVALGYGVGTAFAAICFKKDWPVWAGLIVAIVAALLASNLSRVIFR